MLRKVNLICVGTLKKEYLNNLCIKYKCSINFIIINESNIYHESRDILNIISKVPKYNCILFDLNGEFISNSMFRDTIFKNLREDIYFIIGGSYGVLDKVRSRCGLCIKLSNFTYTHQVFRIIGILFINSLIG